MRSLFVLMMPSDQKTTFYEVRLIGANKRTQTLKGILIGVPQGNFFDSGSEHLMVTKREIYSFWPNYI